MPTRAQVLSLLGRGSDIEAAARELAVPAGLAFMIATGTPADGAAPTREAGDAAPGLPAPSQLLVNPPAHDAMRDERVLAWVHQRAARELRARP